MSGSIAYEFVIVTALLIPGLGTVVRFGGVDRTDGRRVRLALAGSLVYLGIARGALEAFGGGSATLGPLVAGLLLLTVAAIAAGRLRRA